MDEQKIYEEEIGKLRNIAQTVSNQELYEGEQAIVVLAERNKDPKDKEEKDFDEPEL